VLIVYNNDLYNNGTDGASTYNVYFQTDEGDNGGSNLIKNNVFFGVNSRAMYDATGIGGGSSIDYNLYYKASGNLIHYGGSDYTTFASYQSASSQDANGVTGNPLFTTAGSDFTLQSSSPCIDAGVDVGLVLDYAGNTVPYEGGLPDIGAYESRFKPLSGFDKRFERFSIFKKFKRH